MTTYIWKPGTRKGPVFLAPDSENRGGIPTVILPNGQRIQGRYFNTNEQRHQYIFPSSVLGQAGAQIEYNGNVQTIENTNNSYEGDIKAGWRYRDKGTIRSGGGQVSGGSQGVGQNPDFSTGGPETHIATTPGGQPFVIPGGANFGAIQFNPASYQQAIADARAAGDEARAQYFQNILDSRGAALDLVDTDIEGIKRGLNELGPAVRTAGDADTQSNIGRAKQIDAFSASRIPGANRYNRGQISDTNKFNADEFETAVEKSGIDYRKRINQVLSELATESTGRFGDELLDTLMTTSSRGAASDLASAAGVNPLSGAGKNIIDKFSAKERIDMAFRAQGMIPPIAGQAQQLLQPPVELQKTQQFIPTGVPLNPSNIADRTPVQPNISAGATAQHIADVAQSYQAIPAPMAFQGSIGIQEFNSQMQLGRDEFVANAQQGQIVGQANAIQGGLNADSARDLREQQNQQFQEGLSTANTNQGISAAGQIGAAIIGAAASGGFGSSPTDGDTVGAGSEAVGSDGGIIQTTLPTDDIFATPAGEGQIYGTPAPSASGSFSDGVDPITGGSSGSVQDMSDFEIPSDGQLVSGPDGAPSSLFRSTDVLDSPSQLSGPPGLSGSGPTGFVTPSAASDYSPPSFDSVGGYTPISGDSSDIGVPQFKYAGTLRVGNTDLSVNDYRSTMAAADSYVNGTPLPKMFLPNQRPASDGGPGPSELGLTGAYSSVAGAVKDLGIDAGVIQNGLGVIGSWSSMSPTQRLAAAGQFGVQVLQNKGVFSPADAKVIGAIGGALAALADPKLTAPVRAGSSGVIASNLAVRSFSGNINLPSSINGQAVVGSVPQADGNTGFKLANGTVVSKAALQAGVDSKASLGAYQVLVSNASRDKKNTALQAIGVHPTMVNELIDNVANGNTLAALSVFNTPVPWEHQTEVQKAAAVMQVTGTIQGATSAALSSRTKDQSRTGASVLKGFNVSGSQGYQTDVGGVPISVDATGVNIHGSVGGHDVAINPLTTGATVDFYGVPIPLNTAGVNPMGGPSVSAGSGGSGVSVSPRGVRGQVRGSVNSQIHITVAGSVSSTGAAGVSPTIQFGNSPGAQTGAQVGGQLGGIGGSFFGPIGSAAGSFVGSAIGSVVGNKFFGSPSSRKIRNNYRNNLINFGIAEKGPNNQVNIKLADGSMYDIGKDGEFQFKNSDGTDRFSYEVDWTNPVAADSIPAAHLLEIATGLDPSMTKKDTFNRVAGQWTNAISSNAKNVGDSHKNARAILESKGISAQNLGMRIEGLRLTNNISDQEYGVYLDQLNKIYGVDFKPRDRQQSTDSFLQLMGSRKDLSKGDKEFLKLLTDNKALSENMRRTNERIKGLRKSSAGGLPVPDRYSSQTTENDYMNQQVI